MNPLPPNADELVSAYLDGEAAPDEITIVESSPELMSRVEELRSVSSQLGVPSAVPAAQKEAHIAAALDAFDALFANADVAQDQKPSLTAVRPLSATADPQSATVASPTAPSTTAASTTVRSLEAARERRRPRWFNTGVIAAAAAVMLLFVAAAALSFGRGNSTDDVATAADTAVEASSSDAAEEPTADADENALRGLDAAPAPAAQGTQAPEVAALEASGEAAGDQAVADENSSDADAALDEEEAVDDNAAMSESEEEFAADEDSAETDSDDAYFLGTFDNRAQLKAGLELEELDISIEELLEGATAVEPGIIPTCRDELPEHNDTQPDLVLADVLLDDEGWIVAEIYLLTNIDLTRDIYVLDSDDCTLISALEDQ